jgi:regulator of sigma E protease
LEKIIVGIITLLIFGIVVLIHEFGHFIFAVKSGVLVEEFAIGMGPKIFGIKKGETLYTIRALPLGGYCKMLGEDESNNKNLNHQIICLNVFLSFPNTLQYFSFQQD